MTQPAAKSEKVSIPQMAIPEVFLHRLEDKFNDPESYKRYLKWCKDPETVENMRLFRDVFCRPVPGPVKAEDAVWHLGFATGVWSILDVMTALRIDLQSAEPSIDYSATDDPETEEAASDTKKG